MVASAKHPADPDRVVRGLLETIPAVMAGLRADMRRHGVGHHTHFRALMHVAHGPVSTGELACRFEVSAPTMTRTVDVLEERGWVERRPDDQDRRRVFVCMTDGGLAELGRIRQESERHLTEFLDGASDQELAKLSAGLDVLRDLIDRHHDDPELRAGFGRCDHHKKG